MSLFAPVTLRVLLKPFGATKIVKDIRTFYFSKQEITINTISPWVKKHYEFEERDAATKRAVNWLKNNQDMQKDRGFGTYHLLSGMSSSYPETSGYIIPTLINFGKQQNDPEYLKRCIDCAEWLISIQKPSGGWQSGYVEDNKPEVVFNTGQIIRGQIAVYKETKDEKFLKSAMRAGDWLCEIQDPAGYWSKNSYLNMIRVYDSYVAAPIAELYAETGEQRYKTAVEKHIYWIIKDKMLPNAWFEDCDNTPEFNYAPITHTIAYTIDGILDAGIILNNTDFIEAAQKAADQLYAIFNKKKYLAGRFDRNWKATVDYICVTGCAQTSIIWSKLYEITKNEQYYNSVLKMNDFLIFTQETIKDKTLNGAMPGSYPIWGGYIKYGYPNWATKYFIDAMMLEKKHRKILL
jgi:uncharacterized protein YyaL (SSP411 family)